MKSFLKKNIKKILLGIAMLLIFTLLFSFSAFYKLLPTLPLQTAGLGSSSPLPKSSSTQLFYGVNVEMSQILPTSTRYILNSHGEDLIDIASKLGINMFRITNSTRSFDDNKEAIYTKDQWFKVLDKMQSKKIKALILIETPSTNSAYYDADIKPIYLDFVKRYILDSKVFSHPNVYAIDIKNEPIITDHNVETLKQASSMIKKVTPKTAITVGWWGVDTHKKDKSGKTIYLWDNYEAGKSLESFIDFYSLHMYGFDKKQFGIYINPNLKTKLFLGKVIQALSTKRPIIVTEFGAANGEAVSDQDTIGDPNLQANVYNGVYQAINDLNNPQIKGTIAFQFLSRNPNNDAWAIAKDNGNILFPAASVLQKYAIGTNDQNLNLPLPFKNSEHLLQISDNESSVSAKKGDRIGLKLNLDPNSDYRVRFTKQDLLKEIDKFHLNQSRNIYQGLYQAQSPGQTILTITKSTKCKTSSPCPESQTQVFKVKISLRQ